VGARGGPREQQIHYVDARHEQHQSDSSKQHVERWSDRAEDDVPQRFDGRSARLVGLGVRALEVGGNPRHFVLRRAESDTRREPSHHEDRVVVTRRRARIRPERKPDIHIVAAAVRKRAAVGCSRQDLQHAKVSRVRHHAHNCMRDVVEAKRMPREV
jgi:hypothetical protein